READPLAAEARLLDAAVWHVIDAPGRHVADHHAAHLEAIPRALRLVEIAREHARLESERAVVHLVERSVEVAERGEHRHRPERLLAHDVEVALRVFEQRRLEHRAAPAATA